MNSDLCTSGGLESARAMLHKFDRFQHGNSTNMIVLNIENIVFDIIYDASFACPSKTIFRSIDFAIDRT
jgi:hypothetical protein